MKNKDVIRLIESRRKLSPPGGLKKLEMEGGCGVVGLACNERISGKHIMQSLIQMHNRGNSKGGGIAAFGLNSSQFGVSQKILEEDYLIQVAYLDPSVRHQVEKEFIISNLDVHTSYPLPTLKDYKAVDGLDMKPPEVWRYFCRVKDKALSQFILKNNLDALERQKAEDEFIYQNTYKLNNKFYTSLGEKRAFVLSHGRNMIILKIVGYAEQLIEYYQIENLEARIYLSQRNIYPLFLTDTEVAVLLFDLLNRVYEYPLEYIIEAIAPTTERDFHLLPEKKRKIYRAIQTSHIHSSPDGPWFFIIGQTNTKQNSFQLLGITDTSMLRPQVFAFQENGVSIGLVASEKQAIDATLRSLHQEDKRFLPYADFYWNARGGSYTDGGAFIFTVKGKNLVITDKFGNRISVNKEHDCPPINISAGKSEDVDPTEKIKEFTKTIDQRWRIPIKDRAGALSNTEEYLNEIFLSISAQKQAENLYRYSDWEKIDSLSPPKSKQEILVINCEKFPAEGSQSISRFMVEAYQLGWKNFMTFNWRGQRFCGCGLGSESNDVRIDVFGSSGDYLASGLDGAEIVVHESVQDQIAQIMKSGKLVVYGDVGQTFMYGAKGGEVYVLGNAAGRPLINAVGAPRVIINGTCLDYLAESFMAGNPLEGGGFVILHGLKFSEKGEIIELETPYPGGNLFSLASGGAIYIRDPFLKVEEGQLNGGRLVELTAKDWELILPYLKENERLFKIPVKRLLSPNGELRSFNKVYRKVEAVELKVLQKGHR